MKMATAPVSDEKISDDIRRWMAIGICLTKTLTPALRVVLGNKMSEWYQSLVKSPTEIDTQTFVKHEVTLPHSTIKLCYENINDNATHRRSRNNYDYAVKDSISLAKLLLKKNMARFTNFDQTMDTSAALSIMCVAEPFVSSGDAKFAQNVRSNVRNKWAHCNFADWTVQNFETALNDIECLVKKIGLTADKEKEALDDVNYWRKNATTICVGNPLGCGLYDEAKACVEISEDSKDEKAKILGRLQRFLTYWSKEIVDVQRRLALVEEKTDKYVTTIQEVEKIKNKVGNIAPCVFQAPKKNLLFQGRESELRELERLLRPDSFGSKANIAAICGLGGVGKTSLAAEYAQRKRNYYTGGVYWFSGENNAAFESSAYDVATSLGIEHDSFTHTLSTTLGMIAQNRKPCLIILDNMDEASISKSIAKLLKWQYDKAGHLIITTRRKPNALDYVIRDEICCLTLNCFDVEEAKTFLHKKIGVDQSHHEVDTDAEELVKRLGCLPLALEQVGAYIKALQPCTISGYLELYDEERLRLLDEQAAPRVTEYDSPERLAVCTTWHLNFEYIKQTPVGQAASIFLYASAFFNPNEIQKDIINVGEPPIKNENYSKCIKKNLGLQQIVKVLTDFSLFKESSHNLSVHSLVQEVIREDLNRDQKVKFQSVIDAIRMLNHAFRNCSSPDELISVVSDERSERPSIVSSSNPSRFYQWHKLCSHSHELLKHLKSMVKKPDENSRKIFQPETARIVYECAIHLSVNSKHDEAKEIENFAKAISTNIPFPHIIPLPELVRRHIQYSCNMPPTSQQDECVVHQITPEQVEKLRMSGDDEFKKGYYNDSLSIYSHAIDASRNTPHFDVTLLSNRASAYLKLQKYDEALQDAEEYILHSPKCGTGYAKKALALAELNDIKNARVAASLAYYYDRNIFRHCEPFKRKFNSSPEEMRLFVCRDILEFSAALKKAKGVEMDNMVPDQPDDLPVIVLEPGKYEISLQTVDSCLFSDNSQAFIIGNCTLRGEGGDCSVTCDGGLHLKYGDNLLAYNINFHSAKCSVPPSAVVKFSNCSFQGSGLRVEGKLQVDSCKFYNCPNSGLLVLGSVKVENSEFYKNGEGGIEVRDGGLLAVERTKLLANKQGLLIGPRAKDCVVEASQVYDNKSDGVMVDSASDITIKRNCIYDNEGLGIRVQNRTRNVSILENEILGNGKCGICVRGLSKAILRKNGIHRNLCGGICLDARDVVVEDNHISHNLGDGICHGELPTEQRGNIIHDNRARGNQFTAEGEAKLCHYCKKPGMDLEKCENCFTAQYCGKGCKENDWENHLKICGRLLSESSTVLTYKPYEECSTLDSENGSQPNASRFIVKVSMQQDPSVVRLYDYSRKLNGTLTGADQVSNLIQRYGTVGLASHASKELFLWVKRSEDGTVRVFTNVFPSSQCW